MKFKSEDQDCTKVMDTYFFDGKGKMIRVMYRLEKKNFQPLLDLSPSVTNPDFTESEGDFTARSSDSHTQEGALLSLNTMVSNTNGNDLGLPVVRRDAGRQS